MPLIQSGSKKVMHKNAAIEMAHGKKRSQAWAIAYGIWRKNKGKAKKRHYAKAN